MKSNSKSYFFRIATTDGNGFCDCGDPEAFTAHYMCQIHEELAKKEVTPEDVLATFPDDVKIRAGALIKIVSSRLDCQITVCKFQDFSVFDLYVKSTFGETRICKTTIFYNFLALNLLV